LDQGYNALEAMAKGKVVFTGAGPEFSGHYHLDGSVAVDAVPDTDKLAGALATLVDNPETLVEIGKRAREFVEREHHYIDIARRYVAVWESVRPAGQK
jgi:glycosyltransferase involved in cell wall biosynthesis